MVSSVTRLCHSADMFLVSQFIFNRALLKFLIEILPLEIPRVNPSACSSTQLFSQMMKVARGVGKTR